MATGLVLYDYWRSSAAYRVRIALNLKGLSYESRAVHLVRDGGEQHLAAYRAINPQELIPSLLDGALVLTQSLAIIEYLDETRPEVPLLPADAGARARVRAMAMTVASDAHPISNLRVMQYLQTQLDADEPHRLAWTRHWIATSFSALETMLAGSAATGRYCHGDVPGMADVCLVPQFYNAVRWGLPLDAYPTVQRICSQCSTLEAFQRAAPEAQPDAPAPGA